MVGNKIRGGHALRIAVGITALVLLLAGGAGAPTLTVNASGGANYTRIQDAIDNASAGDTILVNNGTYYEHVNMTKNNLNLIGQGGKISSIFLNGTDNNTLKGFTILPPEFFSSMEEKNYTKLSGIFSAPIKNNYSLVLNSIDARAFPRQAWLTFSKNGSKLDDKVVAEGESYTYSSGQTYLNAVVEKIFAGTIFDFIILNHTYLSESGIPIITDERLILVTGGETPVLYTTGGIDWSLYEGYSFTFGDLDEKAYPAQVWLRMSKNGVVIDEKVLNVGDNYSFYKKWLSCFQGKDKPNFRFRSYESFKT